MYQENAQGSNNIAQKMPSFIHEFRNRNVTPDAILLDNSMIDVKFGIERPWFEAIVRVFLSTYPDVVIISVVDAVPSFVDVPGNYDYNHTFAPWLRRVQEHYGLAVVDVAKMVRHMRLHGNDDDGGGGNRGIVRGSIDDYRQRRQRRLQHPKVLSWHSLRRWLVRRGIIAGEYSNEDSAIIDLLWPQSTDMITPNGTIMHNLKDDFDDGEVYWLNFLPMSRKTKWAWHPQNHPPWATHQYVADAVMHALMGVANVGSGCDGRQDDEDGDDPGGRKSIGVPSLLEEAVSPRETLDDCFICRSPLSTIDAKFPENAGGRSVANLTDSTFTNFASKKNDHRADVAVTCGDWHWITDGRNRSGWQSDQRGSLIRFRMKVNSDKLPTFSMTYMKSHKTFGSLMVTFRAVSRKEAAIGPSSPTSSLLLGCNDVSKFRDIGWKNEPVRLQMMDNATIIPSVELSGLIPQYSLWETVVFPATIDTQDVVADRPWYLLNRTVLSHMMMTSDSNNEDAVEFVDIYAMNPTGRRIKVQVVTSC
jgi:hypothetical protein